MTMTEKVEHTELPWTQWGGLVLDENDNLTVASCHEPDGPTTEEHKANAAYIVLACNSYPTLLAERDRLREALKGSKEKFEKLASWLEGLAADSEKQAETSARFESLAAACKADANNYRATAKNIRKEIARIYAALKDTNQ